MENGNPSNIERDKSKTIPKTFLQQESGTFSREQLIGSTIGDDGTLKLASNYPSWISWILLLLPLIASGALLGLNLYYYFTDQTNYMNIPNGTIILWVSLGLFILSLVAGIISLVPYFYQYIWITYVRIATIVLAFTPIPGLAYNLYSYFTPPTN